MPIRYRTVLFDADDTLLDYERAEVEALRNLLGQIGRPCTGREEKMFTALCDRLWKEFGLDRTNDPYISRHYHEWFFAYSVRRFEIFARQLQIAEPAEKLSTRYLECLSLCGCLKDGAYEVCRALSSRRRLSIVTNGLWEMQRMRMERSRLSPFFSHLIVSEQVQCAKPDRDFFQYALELSQVTDKSEVLIVGDSLSNDIAGGSQCGIDTCWLNCRRLKNESSAVPTYTISNLFQLFSIIR